MQRERERDRHTHTHTDTQTQIDWQRQRHRHRDRETETGRQTERETKRQAGTQTHGQRQGDNQKGEQTSRGDKEKTQRSPPHLSLLYTQLLSLSRKSQRPVVQVWHCPDHVTSTSSFLLDRLVGLVVKASGSGAEDPGFDSCLRRDFFPGSNHTSDLNNGTSVATPPGAWHYRISAGICLPGVSILWLGEVESLICVC